MTAIAQFDISEADTFRFVHGQLETPDTITENIGFNAPIRFDLADVVPRSTIESVTSVSISPASETSPVLGTPTLSWDKKSVQVPVDTTQAVAGNYIITVTFTNASGHTLVRKGPFVLK